MPPKTNPLTKLKAAQKKQAQKPTLIDENIKSKKTKKPNIQNIAEVSKITKEEQRRKEFFENILEIDDINNIIEYMVNFSTAYNAYWTRKSLFESILNELPEDLNVYHNFAKQYTNQSDLNLDKFWEKYKANNEDIIKSNRIKKEKEEEKEKEEKEVNILLDKLLNSNEEIEIREKIEKSSKRSKKSKRPTKFGDISPGRTFRPYEKKSKPPTKKLIFGESTYDKSLIIEYKNAPWLKKGKIKKIYIKPVNNSNLSQYVNLNEIPKIIDGEQWFSINKNFYYLVLGPKSLFNEQSGETLSVTDKNNEILFFELGFETNTGFIIQNEIIFKNQKNYYKTKNKTEKEKIKELRTTPINEKIIELGKQQLSYELHIIAPNIRDYGTDKDYNTEYISEVINLISTNSKNIEEFYKKLGKIIIFLHIDTAQIFKERIKSNYYFPKLIFMVSVKIQMNCLVL
jgi:hypothetical protein